MVLLLAALAAVGAYAQSWSSAYDTGLKAARAGKWAEARAGFQQAAAYRPEDMSAATVLPGPPTEQRRWRNGAPYSPNFLAAYAEYRLALENKDPSQQTQALNTAAAEFETLLAKGEYSPEAFYYLNTIYTRSGDTAKRQALEQKFNQVGSKADWKVDTEVVAPEDLAAMSPNGATNPAQARQGSSGTPATLLAGDPRITSTGSTSGFNLGAGPAAAVALVPSKYALLVGTSEAKLAQGNLSYATDDVQRVREALISSAGYPEQNIDIVLNGTAGQVMAAAKALADRMPTEGTLLIYFVGPGVDIDGKDYLAGVDSQLDTDTASMVSKADLYRIFMSKGTRIFAFFQTNRPIVNGNYFGKEVPLVGSIAQMQATTPGQDSLAYFRNGKNVGVFTNAFVNVITELRSNRIPITEFGWQVFYKVMRGDTGDTGGGSHQVPTLPYLTNMAADARF